MITGVLGAAAHTDVRRILSFHIVSQIGYMILGLALFTPLALVGAVFYLIHHIIVKANLFLIGGVINRVAGSFDLDRLGGLYRSQPAAGGAVPGAGFLARRIPAALRLLGQADPDQGQSGSRAISDRRRGPRRRPADHLFHDQDLDPGVLEAAAGGRAAAAGASLADSSASRCTPPIIVMCGVTVTIGIWAEPFFIVAERAAQELIDPAGYIGAVLGGSR